MLDLVYRVRRQNYLAYCIVFAPFDDILRRGPLDPTFYVHFELFGVTLVFLSITCVFGIISCLGV